MKKIYLVGNNGPEHNIVNGVFDTYEKALKKFHELRIELLEEAQERSEDKDLLFSREMYNQIIENLEEEDPEKIDNYPQETPYIQEEELK